MLSKLVTTALIASSSLITTGCRTDDVQGVLAGAFANEAPIVNSIVIPASATGEYYMHHALLHDESVCLLTGQIALPAIPFFYSCKGLSGTGRISCNDGRALDVDWSLTSCQGGYGRSKESGGSRFYFGFGDNEARALDQLKKARTNGEPRAARSAGWLW